MERFSYENLAALRAESGELMRMLMLEQWGVGKDREEEKAKQDAKMASMQNGM